MKRNKKRWSWTDKNKRKTQHFKESYGNCAPKSFRRAFDGRYSNETKTAIFKELKGEDGIFPLRTRRHQALYDWC